MNVLTYFRNVWPNKFVYLIVFRSIIFEIDPTKASYNLIPIALYKHAKVKLTN